MARLFKIFKKDSPGIINTDLIEVMDRNAKLWAKLDMILDMIFLRNQNIIDEKNRIITALDDIVKNEEELDNIASHIIRNSV